MSHAGASSQPGGVAQVLECAGVCCRSKTRDEWGKIIEVRAQAHPSTSTALHSLDADVAPCMWQGLGGLPCGPLRNVGEGYRDEQARHRRMVETVQHPTAGNIPLAGEWPHSLPTHTLGR